MNQPRRVAFEVGECVVVSMFAVKQTPLARKMAFYKPRR